MTRTPGVELHRVVEQTGVWCPTCHAPSAARILLLVARIDTLAVVGRGVVHACGDCGEQYDLPD